MERREVVLVRSFRGSKSRNKVSVGEPAEGSLPKCYARCTMHDARCVLCIVYCVLYCTTDRSMMIS